MTGYNELIARSPRCYTEVRLCVHWCGRHKHPRYVYIQLVCVCLWFIPPGIGSPAFLASAQLLVPNPPFALLLFRSYLTPFGQMHICHRIVPSLIFNEVCLAKCRIIVDIFPLWVRGTHYVAVADVDWRFWLADVSVVCVMGVLVTHSLDVCPLVLSFLK